MVGLLSKIIVTDAALITKLSVGQVLSFLDLVILYESADLEKGRNNSSSDNIGLVPEVLRCILGISEVGLDSKKLLGQSGVFRSLFSKNWSYPTFELSYKNLMFSLSL